MNKPTQKRRMIKWRKFLFVLVFPLIIIPISILILLDFIFEGTCFQKGWRKYIRDLWQVKETDGQD